MAQQKQLVDYVTEPDDQDALRDLADAKGELQAMRADVRSMRKKVAALNLSIVRKMVKIENKE